MVCTIPLYSGFLKIIITYFYTIYFDHVFPSPTPQWISAPSSPCNIWPLSLKTKLKAKHKWKLKQTKTSKVSNDKRAHTQKKSNGVRFVLAKYSWAWSLCTWYTDTQLGKSDFFFISRYELQRFPCLGVGLSLPILLSLLVSQHTGTYQVLCVLSESVSSYMHQSCWFWKMLFSWCHLQPLVMIVCHHPLPHRSRSLMEGG